jgi:tripartite-type tricarboxylate transporter receptor subunit TctC
MKKILFGLILCVSAAHAQQFPSKPVRIVVPYPPGAVTDTLPRMVADKLREQWGQPVVVENKPGASGRIGTEAVAKSPPDGYTLAVGIVDTVVTAPYLVKNLPYDPVKDLVPVTMLARQSYVLVARQELPASNTAELVKYAKANPGKLRFGSWGLGSGAHLGMEMLKSASGANLEHVPYKGSAAVTVGLLAGEVDVMFSGYSALLPHVKAGKVKILGRASLQRMAITPDVPTIAEQGFPGMEVQAWYGLFAPAGTPRAVVDQIQRATAKALESPDIKTRLDAFYVEPVGDTPEAFGKTVNEERARWSKLIKSLNIDME